MKLQTPAEYSVAQIHPYEPEIHNLKEKFEVAALGS